MKIIKKSLSIVMLVMLVFSLVACSGTKKSDSSTDSDSKSGDKKRWLLF